MTAGYLEAGRFVRERREAAASMARRERLSGFPLPASHLCTERRLDPRRTANSSLVNPRSLRKALIWSASISSSSPKYIALTGGRQLACQMSATSGLTGGVDSGRGTVFTQGRDGKVVVR